MPNFPINTSDGACENVKAAGLKIVYDKRYPSATIDLGPAGDLGGRSGHRHRLLLPTELGWTRAVNEIG
jgi:hypothetical protein